MKPAFGGGWKSVYKIHSLEEAARAYEESGTLTMTLQEFIDWDDYIRCLGIGRRHARAIQYVPRPLGQGEYLQDRSRMNPDHLRRAEEYSVQFNQAVGYDMNAMEFAVKGDTLYAIDITNYVCDFDLNSLREAHFGWAVETMCNFILEVAHSGARNEPCARWAL